MHRPNSTSLQGSEQSTLTTPAQTFLSAGKKPVATGTDGRDDTDW